MTATSAQRSRRECWADRRGVVALEFALMGLPFLMLLMFVLELSLDLFTQAALDGALQTAARQIQTGNAQNAKSGADFIANYLCPALGGLLTCTGLYVKVEKIAPSPSQDYWDYTTGAAPVSGGALDLSSYGSAIFCNSGPAQMLLVSAVYVGPTFLGPLIPASLAVTFKGNWVHPTLSTVGMVSEGYAPAAAVKTAAAAC